MPYHTRNRVPIEDIRRGKKAVAKQEDIILAFFEAHPNGMHTPFAVHEGTGAQWPLTSTRRAITDLTNAGKLEKVIDHQRLEVYGVRNCCWRLVKKPDQFELALTAGS